MTQISTEVGNDANVAALGEMWKGGGKGEKNAVMVTLGTGVGGGVIIGGKVVVGTHGAGGEIGHLCVNYEETEVCGCGNKGCLEQYASATGIVRLAKKKLEYETRKTALTAESVTAKDVFDAVKAGDVVAREVAEEFGRYLGYCLANLAAGRRSGGHCHWRRCCQSRRATASVYSETVSGGAFFANRDVHFKLAALGNDAGICGAAKLVLDERG